MRKNIEEEPSPRCDGGLCRVHQITALPADVIATGVSETRN